MNLRHKISRVVLLTLFINLFVPIFGIAPSANAATLAMQIDPANPSSYPGSGNTVTDVISGASGTMSNVTYSGSTNCGIFSFNGTSSKITFGQKDFGNTFSMSFWYKTSSLGSTIQTFMSNASANLATNGFKIEYNSWTTSDGKLIFESGNGSSGGTVISASGSQVVLNTWHHFVYTFNKSTNTAAIYKDKNLIVSGTSTSNFGSNNANWWLGSMGGNSYWLNGNLGITKIYSTVLDQTEVNSDYNSTSARYSGSPSCPTTTTFSHTGAAQTWTVPSGVTSVDFSLTGGSGGDDYGGKGAVVTGTLAVTPGEVLQINVGGRGATYPGGGTSNWTTNAFGGGGRGNYYGSGGGGATDIRKGSYALADRVAVAGGGGGGAQVGGYYGGSGGTTNGAQGQPLVSDNYLFSSGGRGGTQSAGGIGGSGATGCGNRAGSNGSLGSGGDGANASSGAAGGGGGYYGGGGGGSGCNPIAGGGGSSWISNSVVTSPNYYVASSLSAGTVTISYGGAAIVNPTISTISPNTGTSAGGTSITISGTGFASGATVTIGGASATVTGITSTQITATTPSGTVGAANVVVTNTDTGSITSNGGFSYTSAPTIASASISGTANMGETLTATAGTIGTGGLTTTTTYQWVSSSTSTGTYSNISSATNSTYTIKNTDIGRFIKVVITVTNSLGNNSATSSATAMVNDGLIMRYDAGNTSSYSGSGTSVTNLAGAGFTGTLSGSTGTPTFNSHYGKFFTFDASKSQFVTLGSVPAIDFSKGFTATFWANFGSSQNNWERILDFGNGAAANNVWVGRNATSNKLSIETFATATSNGICSSTGDIPTTSTWNHYAVTVDASGCNIYINGVEGHTGTTAVPTTISRSNNYLGKSNWTGDAFFESGLARISVWNRALDSTEIAARVTAETPSPQIGLSTTSISATYGTAITSLTTTPYGGTPTSYSISPSLPSGLSFSTVTGTVSGTPTAVSSSNTYTITANGMTGTPTASFTLAVNGFTMLVAPPAVAVKSGSESTSITVSFSSYTNASNSTNNASSFTVRVYEADGTTLVGSARTNFVSGTAITGLTPGTLYKVSLQAIGDGTNILSSNESSKSSIVTYPAAGTQLISHNSGRALHASATWGQTFKTPVGTAGNLLSISNLHITFRDTFVGTAGAKIYTSPQKTTLLGTSSDICADTDSNAIYPNGSSPDFNGPDCSFKFSGVTLAENTTYYFEIYRLTGGSTFYLWESYDNEGSPYADGDVYLYGQSTPTANFDVKFIIVVEGTPPAAPTLTGAAISGTATQGQQLTASVQGAGGGAATTTSYQWKSSSDDVTYSNISGATSSAYTLTSNEVGKYVKVTITVSNSGGSNSATSTATSAIASNLAITSISPTSGSTAGGTTVTINGSGFASGASVKFGSSSGTSVTVVSSSQITVVTPSGTAGTANVVVTNTDSSTVTSTGAFTYIPVLSNASAPTVSLTSGSEATSITVSFSSVTNASSYTVRVYLNDGATLVGSARTNFTSGSTITGLSANTAYKVSVQATGNGTSYVSSAESSKSSITTNASVVNLTITQNVGTAQHANYNWGQTFKVPAGTSGTLASISNMHMSFRGTFVGTVEAKLYTDTTKSTLLGTSPDICADTDSTLGGQLYADFNGPDCTFTFSGITLSENTTYYFEINRLTGGSTFYLWEYYASGGTLYSNGMAYQNGTGYPDWDLKFTVNYLGNPPPAPTLTGAAISGTTTQGQTLTASIQGAGGGTATSTTYQWSRADSSGGTYTNISGATNSTYLLTSNDVGKYLKVKITVANVGGTNNATSSATTVINGPSVAPTITSINKNAGTTAGGVTVTISGTNLSNVSAVTFDGSAATISSKTSTTVVVVTPAHAAGAVNVVVTNPSGSATSTNGYTYVTVPTTRSWTTTLSRTTASLNDTVTVTYQAVCTTPQTYGPSMYDLIYKTAGTWAYNSYMGSGTSTDGGYTWTITKTYTLNSTGIWTVDAYERGACWDSYNFTYAPRNYINVGVAAPTITSLGTTSGPLAGGTTVILSGTDLTGVTGITVGGTAATSIRSNTATSVTFNTPAGTAGAKNVVVTTPAGSVTATGAFTYVAPITVTYDTNTATAGAPSRTSDSYTPNSGGYSLPTVGTMVKTGHSFSGWTTASDSTTALTSPYNPTSSRTLYAIWTAKTYTITYNANGATSGTAPTATTNTFGSSVTLAGNSGGSSLSRTGYTLAGWVTKINGEDTQFNIGASNAFNMPAENLIVYADWVLNTYSVTYDANGANEANPTTQSGINANGTVTLAAALTKPSNAFVGWEENGITYLAGATYRIGSSNVTMVAKWIPVYTVVYNLNGTGATGTLPADTLKNDGDTLTVTSNVPTRTGYTFGGWIDQSGTVHATSSTYTINSSNYLLYAVWTPVSYSVTYALDGGSSTLPTEANKNYRTTFTLAAAPTKTGYTFTGWSDSSTVYSAVSSYVMPADNVTLTAQWIVNSYVITYDLAQGTSSVPDPVTKNFGAQWSLPNAPTRVGYNFTNWSDGTSTFAGGASYTLSAASNLVITAQWSPIVYYTITYDLAGGKGAAPTQDPLENGTTFNLPAAPAKTGASFTGWSYNGQIYNASYQNLLMPAQNITITATWVDSTAGTNVASYIANGAQTSAPASQAVKPGDKFIVDDGSSMVKSGYNFSGWMYSGTTYTGGEEFTMPSNDVSFSAIWVPQVRSTSVSHSVDSNAVTRGRSITVTYSLGCYNYSTLPSLTEKVTSTGESFINDITASMTVIDAGYNWTVTRVYTLSFVGTYTITATASGGCFASDTDSTPSTVVVTEAPTSGGTSSSTATANNSGGTGASGSAITSIPPVTVVGARIALVANKYYTLPKLAPTTTLSVAAKAGASASTAPTTPSTGTTPSSGATTMLTVNSAATGLSEVKIVENQLAVVPTQGFSGKTTVSVTVTDGTTTSKIDVPVTVLPEPVKDPTLTPKTVTTTVVTWDPSPNATNYQVFVEGKSVCKTSGESCTIKKILGPNAEVEVVANGGDATKSEVVAADYEATSHVTVARISGTYNRSTLSANDVNTLNKVIKTIKAQGFENVQITGITSTKLTTAAAKARLDAMVAYIKEKVDDPDLTVKVVAPTTRTFTNQIAVK